MGFFYERVKNIVGKGKYAEKQSLGKDLGEQFKFLMSLRKRVFENILGRNFW